MNFIKTYDMLETGDFDIRTGKRLFPHTNLHYSSSISPPGTHTSGAKLARQLPVPQATANRLRRAVNMSTNEGNPVLRKTYLDRSAINRRASDGEGRTFRDAAKNMLN